MRERPFTAICGRLFYIWIFTEKVKIGKKEYELVLTTTTNLPLEYSILKNGSNCSKTEEIYTDDDGSYYKRIKLPTVRMNHGSDTTDKYVLKVTFPKSNYTNTDYADLIEYIKIDLSAKQIIE